MGTVNLNRVTTNTSISSANENSNQALLEAALNGNIDASNLSASKIVTPTVHLTQDSAANGQVLAYDGLSDNRWEPTNVSSLIFGTLIGAVQYNPTTVTTVGATTTGADVDATNLKVDVTIPPGCTKILVQFSAANSSTATLLMWGIREGVTDIAYAKLTGVNVTAGTRFDLNMIVTGLVSGAHTYKWAHKTITSTSGTQYGTQASPAQADPGPALMAIWTVP